MRSLSSIKLNISKKLTNKEYFHKFFKVRSQDEIAEAIRDLREDRGYSQMELAEMTGMKQSAVSRIEKPTYGNWNFKTLWRVAKALDARWKLVLDPMESVIEEYKEKEKWLNSAPEQEISFLSEDKSKADIGEISFSLGMMPREAFVQSPDQERKTQYA
jgi:transcriptional regulator with XRE-family HTH domain